MPNRGRARLVVVEDPATGEYAIRELSHDELEFAVGLAVRRWELANVASGDRIQLATTLGPQALAWVAALSLERLGVLLIPTGGIDATSAVQQVEIARSFGTTTLVSTPDQLGALASAASQIAKGPADLGIRKVVVIGGRLGPLGTAEAALNWAADIYQGMEWLDGIAWDFAQCAWQVRSAADRYHYWPDSVAVELGHGLASTGERRALVLTSRFARTTPAVEVDVGGTADLIESDCACGSGLPSVRLVADEPDVADRGERP